MKQCRGCEQSLPVDRFYTNPNTRDGRLNYCKACVQQRYGPGVKARAKALREHIAAIKLERGCADCGYNSHAEALDFDHLPGFDKQYRIATMSGGSTKAKIEEEIAKCDVVCANCHRVRTAQRRAAS